MGGKRKIHIRWCKKYGDAAGAEGSVLCDHTRRVIVPRPFDVPACATVASSLCIVTACPTWKSCRGEQSLAIWSVLLDVRSGPTPLVHLGISMPAYFYAQESVTILFEFSDSWMLTSLMARPLLGRQQCNWHGKGWLAAVNCWTDSSKSEAQYSRGAGVSPKGASGNLRRANSPNKPNCFRFAAKNLNTSKRNFCNTNEK